MKKILITGGPKTGKSTHADTVGLPIRRSDQLVNEKAWGAQSEEVARWMDEPGDLVIEGGSVVRGLRKWMAQNPGKSMREVEIRHLSQPHAALSDGQARMHKGVETIWGQVRAEAIRRGATVKD